jgi:hypothetical protein
VVGREKRVFLLMDASCKAHIRCRHSIRSHETEEVGWYAGKRGAVTLCCFEACCRLRRCVFVLCLWGLQKSAMQRVELAAGRAEAATYDDLRTELTGFTAAMASSARVEVSHVHLCMEWSSHMGMLQ